MKADGAALLETSSKRRRATVPNKADWLDGRWAGFRSADAGDDPRRGETGVDIATC